MAATDDFRADTRAATGASAWDGPVTIHVNNERPHGMKIFAIQDGVRMFVGQVGSRQSAVFRISRALLGPNDRFRLYADPVQSTLDQQSELIDASKGRNVAWLLRRGGGERVRVY